MRCGDFGYPTSALPTTLNPTVRSLHLSHVGGDQAFVVATPNFVGAILALQNKEGSVARPPEPSFERKRLRVHLRHLPLSGQRGGSGPVPVEIRPPRCVTQKTTAPQFGRG
jgi:hypothetical protein